MQLLLRGPSEAWLGTAGSHRITPVVHGALQTCLHVPAGLVISAAEPQAAQQTEADEALVAQQAADVAQLQAEIAAVGFLDERAACCACCGNAPSCPSRLLGPLL